MKKDTIAFSEDIISAINDRTLSHNRDCITEIFSKYNLTEYLDYFINCNDVVQENTYHNNIHTFSVVLNVFEGSTLHALSKQEITHLLLASLFHDFKHSQGKYSEKFNITVATSGFERAVKEINIKNDLKEEEIDNIISLIKSTRFPYPIKKCYNLLEKILLDSDNMIMYEAPNTTLKLILGLYNELNTNNPIGVKVFYNQQNIHHSSVVWRSHYGYVKAQLLNYPEKAKNILFELNNILKTML